MGIVGEVPSCIPERETLRGLERRWVIEERADALSVESGYSCGQLALGAGENIWKGSCACAVCDPSIVKNGNTEVVAAAVDYAEGRPRLEGCDTRELPPVQQRVQNARITLRPRSALGAVAIVRASVTHPAAKRAGKFG